MLNFKSYGFQKQSQSLSFGTLDSQRLVLLSSSGGTFACTNAHTQVYFVFFSLLMVLFRVNLVKE